MTTRANTLLPFRRLTKPRSVDPAGNIKVGFFLLFIGFSSHILFFEVLVLLLKLETTYMLSFILFEVTGLPEIDILTPLIIISLSPFLLISTNPFLFLISIIPWVFSGFLTGLLFGPQHGRAIVFAPPVFMGSIITLWFFLLFSIAGLGELTPSVGILLLSTVILILSVFLVYVIFLLSMVIAIPALIGYTFGKNKTLFAISPRIFIAQPDREDPSNTRCRFLTPQNHCNVAARVGVFFPNICDNKWNQVTCSYYLRQIAVEKMNQKYQQGDYIDEIK
ncbi:MAG: hypothetical protein ACFFB5_04130 [Promethearchaeota archaeon]